MTSKHFWNQVPETWPEYRSERPYAGLQRIELLESALHGLQKAGLPLQLIGLHPLELLQGVLHRPLLRCQAGSQGITLGLAAGRRRTPPCSCRQRPGHMSLQSRGSGRLGTSSGCAQLLQAGSRFCLLGRQLLLAGLHQGGHHLL